MQKMANCRVYQTSDGSSVRFCRKCKNCVILDDPSTTDTGRTSHSEKCRLYQEAACGSNVKICTKCKTCVVTDSDTYTSFGPNKSTTGTSCGLSSICHYDMDRNVHQVYEKRKKSESSQTNCKCSAEAQTVVIEIAKHQKDVETNISEKYIPCDTTCTSICSAPSSWNVPQENSKSYANISTQKQYDEEVHEYIDQSTSCTRKNNITSFFCKIKNATKKPAMGADEKEAETINDKKPMDSHEPGNASCSCLAPTKITSDAQLLEEIARIRKLLEQNTCANTPNTKTIILPSDPKVGDQSGDLKRLQDAFRDGALNSRKDLQDVLNEVQKQKQEIATLKQLLRAFIDSYDEISRTSQQGENKKESNNKRNSETSLEGSITGRRDTERGKYKKESKDKLASLSERSMEDPVERRGSNTGRGDAEREKYKREPKDKRTVSERSFEDLADRRGSNGRGDAGAERKSDISLGPSATENELVPEQEIKYKKPAAFSDGDEEKQSKWCCWGKKGKKSKDKNFENRHDPRRQSEIYHKK